MTERSPRARVHEVVRLEQIAELAIRDDGDGYADALRRPPESACRHIAIATKSILAYRGGFDGDL